MVVVVVVEEVRIVVPTDVLIRVMMGILVMVLLVMIVVIKMIVAGVKAGLVLVVMIVKVMVVTFLLEETVLRVLIVIVVVLGKGRRDELHLSGPLTVVNLVGIGDRAWVWLFNGNCCRGLASVVVVVIASTTISWSFTVEVSP